MNAEEEPERPYWPKEDKAYTSVNSPRGVLKCWATDTDDMTDVPHWGKVGKQKIVDTGPLTRKRMETIDDETTQAAIDYMTRQVKAGKPFFVWMNNHPHASLYACARVGARPERDAWQRICRRHDRA